MHSYVMPPDPSAPVTPGTAPPGTAHGPPANLSGTPSGASSAALDLSASQPFYLLVDTLQPLVLRLAFTVAQSRASEAPVASDEGALVTESNEPQVRPFFPLMISFALRSSPRNINRWHAARDPVGGAVLLAAGIGVKVCFVHTHGSGGCPRMVSPGGAPYFSIVCGCPFGICGSRIRPQGKRSCCPSFYFLYIFCMRSKKLLTRVSRILFGLARSMLLWEN
jgi:hypothetical protein